MTSPRVVSTLEDDLREQVSESSPLVEEMPPLELPATHVSRQSTADVEVCGARLAEGSKVAIAMATADRETDNGADPDEIDLLEPGRGHLTFGGAIHRCLSSHLTRRELRLVVEQSCKRIPEYRIRGDFEPRIVWTTGTYHLESPSLVINTGRTR